MAVRKDRVIMAGVVALAIVFVGIWPAHAEPVQTGADMQALCVAAQRPGNTLTSAQRTWAAQCVAVAREGQRLLPSASASASPSASPSSAPPPPAPPPAKGFPDATNTGVPVGTALSTYLGCSGGEVVVSQPDTVIDAKDIPCDLVIRTTGVQVTRSRIHGLVNTPELSSFSFSLTDTEVDAGLTTDAAVGTANLHLLRVNAHGGATSVYCWAHCDIRDSYLHGQRIASGSSAHLGGFLANDNGAFDGSNDTPGAQTDAMVVHNTIVCDASPTSSDGGCSGDTNLYGDFGTVRGVTFDGNDLGASAGLAYCAYGGDGHGASGAKPFPDSTGIVYRNNVFERGLNGKCGSFGPVTSFNPAAAGNVWTGNIWSTGETLSFDGTTSAPSRARQVIR